MSVERQPTYRPVQGAVADDYLADGDCPQLCADAIAQTAPARLLRPYPRQRNPIMPAPQSGQTKLRIAEIKLMPVLQRRQTQPYYLSLPRRMHRTLSAEPQERFLGGRSLETGCGPSHQLAS
jgi:hypothetical protein